MEVDVCSEISLVSPRISFSHDLNELDFVPIESSNNLHLNPTIDFHFDFFTSQTLYISSADDLFSHGKILPVQINQTKAAPPNLIDPTKNDNNSKKKRLIDDDEGKPIAIAKSFWQFRRSSSVSSDRGGRGTNGGILRSLQFLTRSNSTGSVPNPKPSGVAKVMRKQNSLREAPINRLSSAAAAVGFNQYYHYNNPPPPSLGKSRSSGNGVRISPVLNIAPSYTVSFFGIGSLFCSKKSKKKRK